MPLRRSRVLVVGFLLAAIGTVLPVVEMLWFSITSLTWPKLCKSK